MATIINNVRWADNTAELKANLLQGIGTIDAMKASVDRTAASLGGQGLFLQANKVTAAIDQLGGVTKLTAAEQERANATIDKAIEKYKLMGMVAPPAMVALRSELNQTGGAWSDFVSKFDVRGAISDPLTAAKGAMSAFAQELGPVAVAGLAAATAVVAVAAAVFTLSTNAASVGSNLNDVSEKVGLSVPALSRYSNAARVAGSDINTLGSAVFMLQRNIGEGSEKLDTGLKKIGLTVEQLKAAGPDQYLSLIAHGFAQTEDPAAKASAAVEIFNKQGREIIPTLSKLDQALRDTNDIAPWTDEQAKEAEAFEMQLASIKIHAEAFATAIGRDLIGPVSGVVGVVSTVGGALWNTLGVPLGLLTGAWHEASAALDVFRGKAEALPPVTGLAAKGVAAWKDEVKDLALNVPTLSDALAAQAEIERDLDPATRKMAEALTEFNTVGADMKATLEGMDGAVVIAAEDFLKAGGSAESAKVIWGLTAAQVKSLTEDLKSQSDALKLQASIVEQNAKLWDEFNQIASKGGTTFDDQVASIDRWALDLEAKAQKAGTDTAEFYDALTALWNAKLHDAAQNATKAMDDVTNESVADFNAMNDSVMGISTSFEGWNEEVMSVDDSVKKLAKDMASMSQGNTLDLSHAARDPEINELLKEGWSLENAEALKLARQYGFQPKLYDQFGNQESTPSKAERVPGYAEGVMNAPGGWALVGERGPELLNLPRGSNVIPHNFLANAGGGSGDTHVHFYGNVFADRQQFERMVKDVVVKTVIKNRKTAA